MDRKIYMDEVWFDLNCIVSTLSLVTESFSAETIPKEENSVDEKIAAICLFRRACSMYEPALNHIFFSLSDLLDRVKEAAQQ